MTKLTTATADVFKYWSWKEMQFIVDGERGKFNDIQTRVETHTSRCESVEPVVSVEEPDDTVLPSDDVSTQDEATLQVADEEPVCDTEERSSTIPFIEVNWT